MRARQGVFAAAAALALTLTLGACGSSSTPTASQDTGTRTIKVAYQKTATFTQLDELLQKVKPTFEAAHPGVTVDLEPIEAEQDQYFTKLALMNGSKDTAPDVIYEDTFQVMSDAAAGYLLPIDDQLAKWGDWSQFADAAKKAGLGVDGKTYGVSMGTDTRAIYFNKKIFAEAGLPTDWQPTTWAEVISAAETVKAKVPGVTPLNVYAGKASGEATTMQGFEMLYYGTGASLYDAAADKWTGGGQAFTDTLGFYQKIFSAGLAPSLDAALDAKISSRVSSELLPQGKLAMAVDGSWLPGGWISGDNKWDDWDKTMGLAKMPTQNGASPGATSMSGGWLLSVGANTKSPQTAFDFISTALNKDNSLTYDTTNSQIAVRNDVATDPAYLDYNPSFEFFADLVPVTHFRPATPDYSQISADIQVAVESVASGQATPAEATQTYADGLTKIVGADHVATS